MRKFWLATNGKLNRNRFAIGDSWVANCDVNQTTTSLVK